jgi:hypothetical protein
MVTGRVIIIVEYTALSIYMRDILVGHWDSSLCEFLGTRVVTLNGVDPLSILQYYTVCEIRVEAATTTYWLNNRANAYTVMNVQQEKNNGTTLCGRPLRLWRTIMSNSNNSTQHCPRFCHCIIYELLCQWNTLTCKMILHLCLCHWCYYIIFCAFHISLKYT